MEYGAQVHKKTDKRGCWSYRSVDVWYLFASIKHYHTHLSRMKATKSTCLTVLQLNHKNITKVHHHTRRQGNECDMCVRSHSEGGYSEEDII